MTNIFNRNIKKRTESHSSSDSIDYLIKSKLTELFLINQSGNQLLIESILSEMIEYIPNNIEILNKLASIAVQHKIWKKALIFFEAASRLQPNNPYCFNNIGVVLHELKQFEKSIANYKKAISITPQFADAYYNCGNALKDNAQYDLAVNYYDEAIRLKSNIAEFYTNRGNAFYEIKYYEKAISDFEKAILLKPNLAIAYSNKGNALKEINKIEESLASYEKAILIEPSLSQAYYNLGNLYKDIKKFEQAEKNYDLAIKYNPEYADAYWNKSLILLLLGNLQQGWELYEWRLLKKELSERKRLFVKPEWTGTVNLKNKVILIYAEQGLGDVIQFSRYVNLLIELNAFVLLEVQSALVSLYKNVFERTARVTVMAVGDQLPEFDYYCPLMSLPHIFKTDILNIPNISPYLHSDNDKIIKWQAKLGNQHKKRVGIVWSSSSGFKDDAQRSMTFLQILSAFPVSEIELYCLQKEIKEEDKIAFNESGIKYFGNELTDFSETAALIACMDLVISTCTSVPHLSAALGKKTWILLQYVPDWRWMLDRQDSPWYPSVKLFRQKTRGDWNPVLTQIRKELLDWISSKSI